MMYNKARNAFGKMKEGMKKNRRAKVPMGGLMGMLKRRREMAKKKSMMPGM